MYLINAYSLQLKYFVDLDDPGRRPFAALSHRWGSSEEELTFQEIETEVYLRPISVKNKPGYKKLREAARTAKEENLEWIWVDTCCIDKKSSAELQESINSMWRIYSTAALCMVYMNDTTESFEDEHELPPWQESSKPISKTSFEQSQWFTRGWTLQELLAPENIIFYSHDWQAFGTRSSLQDTISSITTIPKQCLDSDKNRTREAQIRSYSAATIMSWAASRRTKRPEDRAYSLLGIFDVQMPLLYGEGDRAFQRLQMEIAKMNNDPTLFLWHPPPADGMSGPIARTIGPPAPTLTPENLDRQFEPCAATATHLLRAEANVILCLKHDSLAIERRFDKHREHIAWIAVDNVSERGAGRLAVSYDIGNTAIIWDISTGGEVARFSAYEEIRVAAWMRNGNLAFGNAKGNIIIFEPSTSEHISSRTIFDPITALAPANDCRTFAVGYLNGSVLIATLQPSFTILHSLTTNRKPSRVATIAWHGTASKQRSEMLAVQLAEGDLRVWSVPKTYGNGDTPVVIRVLNRHDSHQLGPCWFGWVRAGRMVQYCDGETRIWDVRTKHVTCEKLPTTGKALGIAVHGPTSRLFILAANHIVQQYDVNPDTAPALVKEVQHIPSDTPPSPPGSIKEQKSIEDMSETRSTPLLPTVSDAETSESDANMLSPLQKLSRDRDRLEEERESRDRLAPLSPASSRASSTTSKSSRSGRQQAAYLYDQPPSSRQSQLSQGSGTEFSYGAMHPARLHGRESVSVRSSTSRRSSRLQQEILPSPEEDRSKEPMLDLFPFTKARLQDVAFSMPKYGDGQRTPEVLRKEMLRVVFGWNGDIKSLIRDELSHHRSGSGPAILLTKWLGDMTSDSLVSMMGTQSMTSSDWMLLALSSIEKNSQKQVGEAFVQRLLEKGDVHPAVAILLSLGERDDAIEAYVSQKMFLEALLLTCLVHRNDWQRQCFLLRTWGVDAMTSGSADLAARCFSCTSIETNEPWVPSTAQDALAFNAQKQQVLGPASPPLSPPSAGTSARMKNAQLKLITSFENRQVPFVPLATDTKAASSSANLAVDYTPIAQSAVSGDGATPWRTTRQERDFSATTSARTATPGTYGRSRFPSRETQHRRKTPIDTPQTAARDFGTSRPLDDSQTGTARKESSHRKASSQSTTATERVDTPSKDTTANDSLHSPPVLPSPAVGLFSNRKPEHVRNGSRDRMPGGLNLTLSDVANRNRHGAMSPDPASSSAASSLASQSQTETTNDPSEDDSNYTTGSVGKAGEPFLSSLEQARLVAHQERKSSRTRKLKERSASRGREGTKPIKPAKRSPSSPVPMSPFEMMFALEARARHQEASRTTTPAPAASVRKQSHEPAALTEPSPEKTRQMNEHSRTRSVKRSQSDVRGRDARPHTPSPNQPSSTSVPEPSDTAVRSEEQSDGAKPHLRSASRPAERPQAKIEDDPYEYSTKSAVVSGGKDELGYSSSSETWSTFILPSTQYQNPAALSRKELAAKELEERRLSLARRPSAPAIPMPGEVGIKRPGMGPRFHTELGESPLSFPPPYSGPDIARSQTVDPDTFMRNSSKPNSKSTTSPSIGLPATPRAMKHPEYMGARHDENDRVSPIAETPSATTRDQTGSADDDDQLGPLLPPTGLSPKETISRSASAPVGSTTVTSLHRTYKETALMAHTRRLSRGHTRRGSHDESGSPVQIAPSQRSPTEVRASIDETLHSNQVIIIDTASSRESSILPELEHLAVPPPPPPPPPILPSGYINIAIDGKSPLVHRATSLTTTPAPRPDTAQSTTSTNLSRAGTVSPSSQRRGRGSISENAPPATISSRIRNVTERMRSTSRSRAKSPPMAVDYRPSPYEANLPPFPAAMPAGIVGRRESLSRAKSPLENAVSPVGGGFERRGSRNEGVTSPVRNRERVTEVKANMPPSVDALRMGMGMGIGEGEIF
ncbi:hypothetical protein MBLNU457_1185t1 [Dothideomycetes sp. NU457]